MRVLNKIFTLILYVELMTANSPILLRELIYRCKQMTLTNPTLGGKVLRKK